MAEENPKRPARYCIVDFNRNGKLEHLTCCTSSADDEEIATKLSMTPQAYGAAATRLTCVNVVPLIKIIREIGAYHNIDLTRPFLPPPGSEEFKTLFAPYVEARDMAAAIVKARKDKDALALHAGRKAREIAEARFVRSTS
jgi:hypothetical protein